MPRKPFLITSPKIKKLAAKAMKSPSMVTNEETRELGASVMAYLQPPEAAAVTSPAKKTAGKKAASKKVAAKQSASAKKAVAKKTSSME